MKVLLAASMAVALAVVIVTWGCGGLGSTGDCAQFCSAAGACGLLPSPLGASVDGADPVSNCQGQCELTEPGLRATVTSCAPASTEGGWCSDRAPCVALAQCLSTDVPDAGVLGVARLDALPVAAAAYADAGCVAADPGQVCAVPFCTGGACQTGAAGCDACLCNRQLGYSSADANAYCAALGGTEATLWVEQLGVLTRSGPAPCVQALAGPVAFPSLTPGPAKVWIELRAQSVDGGASCFVVPGPRVVLAAGGADVSTVIALPPPAGAGSLPGASHCEGDAVLCANGIDDDGNGLVDCADPNCQAYCTADAGLDAGP